MCNAIIEVMTGYSKTVLCTGFKHMTRVGMDQRYNNHIRFGGFDLVIIRVLKNQHNLGLHRDEYKYCIRVANNRLLHQSLLQL